MLFGGYHDSRVTLELLLEAVPQALFQTLLYVLGSSRSTRIYIDEQIFVRSIAFSLLSVLMHYCLTLWEAIYTAQPFWRICLARVGNWGRPIVVCVNTQEEGENAEEIEASPGVGSAHKVGILLPVSPSTCRQSQTTDGQSSRL